MSNRKTSVRANAVVINTIATSLAHARACYERMNTTCKQGFAEVGTAQV